MCRSFIVIDTQCARLNPVSQMTWKDPINSCAQLHDCHMYICPVVLGACSQMYRIFTAGNVFPVRSHCERDLMKKNICSCFCVAHNFLCALGQANASTGYVSGCPRISSKTFPRSGECCCTEYLWIIWLQKRAIWGDARRSSLTQTILINENVSVVKS